MNMSKQVCGVFQNRGAFIAHVHVIKVCKQSDVRIIYISANPHSLRDKVYKVCFCGSQRLDNNCHAVFRSGIPAYVKGIAKLFVCSLGVISVRNSSRSPASDNSDFSADFCCSLKSLFCICADNSEVSLFSDKRDVGRKKQLKHSGKMERAETVFARFRYASSLMLARLQKLYSR